MAQQTVQVLNHGSGLNLTSLAVAAASGGDKWAGTGFEMLWISVGTTGITITLTYGTGGTVDGQVLPNKTFVLSISSQYLMGPFPPGLYNDGSGNVNVSYTAVTNISIVVFKMGT